MQTLPRKSQLMIGTMLALLMMLTRIDHFGSIASLPDASLAVFFLVGFYLQPAWLFALFLGLAGAIDYVAIRFAGVSNWCVSPAYFFLIPTYGVMWYAGHWYASRHSHRFWTLMRLAGALLVSTISAFLLSDGSFYLLSGRFGSWQATAYAARVLHYLPPYAGYTFLYVLFAAAMHVLIITLRHIRTRAAGSEPGAF